MEVDYFANICSIPTADYLHEEHDTVFAQRPNGLPSQVEEALAKYADSIEGLSVGCGSEVDRYTRGFIAGLRAGLKVAANVPRT
jgi:hypothetical protein